MLLQTSWKAAPSWQATSPIISNKSECGRNSLIPRRSANHWNKNLFVNSVKLMKGWDLVSQLLMKFYLKRSFKSSQKLDKRVSHFGHVSNGSQSRHKLDFVIHFRTLWGHYKIWCGSLRVANVEDAGNTCSFDDVVDFGWEIIVTNFIPATN